MGKVSRRYLDKQLAMHISSLFWKSIAGIKTPEEAEAFFKDLLSPTEELMLIKRLAIAVLLAQGHTYDLIDDTLKVSRPTIMNVSYWLKSGGSGYQKAVSKILANKKKEAILDAIEEVILRLSPHGAVGSIRHEKRQRKGKELFEKRVLRDRF